ncbi:MAG: HNH endonuclease [Candidatus Eisenbacteria bacterium]
MRGVILVTDHDWFQFLSRLRDLDEVNFWRPSDTRIPRQFVPGMPVLFKLRKQFGSWIVGWGLFAKHDVLPAWLAWDAFELRNGAPSFVEMRTRVERLRHGGSGPSVIDGDYSIGCLMLAEPVFLPQERWVRPPSDWPENAVQGKAYDLATGEGKRVWDECQAGLDGGGPRVREGVPRPNPTGDRYGDPVLVRPRLGQGIFRLSVTDAYGRSCAVTQEHSLPALEAAHIKPFGEGGEHEVSNGLLLRSDIHRLFDKGYVGVTPEHRFVVSKRLKDDFSNGRSYYPLHGQEIGVPSRAEDRPSPKWLEWHMAERFRG